MNPYITSAALILGLLNFTATPVVAGHYGHHTKSAYGTGYGFAPKSEALRYGHQTRAYRYGGNNKSYRKGYRGKPNRGHYQRP